jgi:hypothetical protein
VVKLESSRPATLRDRAPAKANDHDDAVASLDAMPQLGDDFFIRQAFERVEHLRLVTQPQDYSLRGFAKASKLQVRRRNVDFHGPHSKPCFRPANAPVQRRAA